MDRDTLDAIGRAIGRAAAILAAARCAIALTGAGISKESGIPAFRGVGGLRTRRTRAGFPADRAAPPAAPGRRAPEARRADALMIVRAAALVYPAAKRPPPAAPRRP